MLVLYFAVPTSFYQFKATTHFLKHCVFTKNKSGVDYHIKKDEYIE